MCGIAGLFDASSAFAARANDLMPMLGRLVHRGPDGVGTWHDPDSGISLGHRRLAIVELSELGAQPMRSANGRYELVYNGEAYNHREMRARLETKGVWLRGGSDTEVLLESIAHYGIEAALRATIGMFSFACWDRAEKRLILARDRMGEKPLYYGRLDGHSKGLFGFASELSALRAHPRFHANLSRQASELYLRYGYVPTPLSIFDRVHKLRPGHWLELSEADLQSSQMPESRAYWSLTDTVEAGRESALSDKRPDADWIDEFDDLLKSATRMQMQADVPVGAFLSGGVDSSLVVAAMQSSSARPVQTFSIGFREAGFDEAPYARAVAAHLGTEHFEHYASAEDALRLAPDMASIYDEPFADSSQIPTLLVTRMARKRVTVSLSGDGGDELFGGYNRYLFGPYAWRKMASAPLVIRKAVASAILSISPIAWDSLLSTFGRLAPVRWRHGSIGDKIHKIARALRAASSGGFYLSLVELSVVGPQAKDAAGAEAWLKIIESLFPRLGFAEKMMLLDCLTFLPDDILCKVDRASMSASLEARVPLLDWRMVEFAWRLPMRMKIRGGMGKWIMRQTLNRYAPAELFNRPKAGFSMPLGEWLRGPLRPWADDLLSEASLRQSENLGVSIARTRTAWREHLSGRANNQTELWAVLMLQGWLRTEPKQSPLVVGQSAHG